jgi:integrase
MERFRLFIGDKSQDWYVEVNPGRKRIYHGFDYGMPKSGNQIKSIVKRREYFKELFRLVQSVGVIVRGVKKSISKKLLLSQAFQIVIDAKSKKLKSRSVTILRRTGGYLINAIGDIPLEYCTASVVITYLDSLTIKPQSVNSIRRDLHTLFSYLVEIELIKINPVAKIKNRKVLKTEKNEAYTLDELKLVLIGCEKYSPNMYLIGVLMFAAFLRASEIIQLTGSCFDFDNDRIVLPSYIRKTNDRFSIPMTAQLKKDLVRFGVDKILDNQPVFHNRYNKQLNDTYPSTAFLRIKVRHLSEWISEHQTLNSIRHTAAVHYFQKTQNVKKLSILMGHTSIQTTIIYLRSLGKIVGEIDNTELLEY